MARVLVAFLVALLLTACTAAPEWSRPTAPGAQPSTSAAPGAEGEDPPLRLKVATYNVLAGSPPPRWFPQIDPAELDPMVREPAIVAKIGHLDADVIGLQEFRPKLGASERLVADLQQYTWVVPDASGGREAVAVPVLYRTARFDLLTKGSERLTTRGESGAFFDRYVSWVELRDHISGRRFFVFNYHAHHRQTPRFAAIRSAAIDRLIGVVEKVNPGLAEPFAIIGDFNARSNDTRKTFNDHALKLGRVGVKDAATRTERDASDVPGAASLNNMAADVAGQPVGKAIRRNGQHIDYVWVPQGARVLSWAIVSGPNVEWRTINDVEVPIWAGVLASDHSPVVAELEFA